MNERPSITDDAINALLETRAGRAKTDGLLASVRLAAASTPQRRAGRFGFGLLRGSLGAGLVGAASIVVLVIALGIASGGHVPGVTTPSGRPSADGSATASASAEPPATPVAPVAAGPVLPLTVDQLNALMATDMNGLIGRRLVITGALRGTSAACLDPSKCLLTALLVGSSPQLEVKSIPTDVSLAADPTFSAIFVDAGTLSYEANVTTAAGGGPLQPSELIDAAGSIRPADVRLVQGWITGLIDPLPCPQLPATPAPGPQFGCGRTAWLTDDKFGPITISGVFKPSSAPRTTSGGAIRVQNDAYQDFAPAPATNGNNAEPELATFLVRAVYANPCSSGLACPAPNRISGWQIVARLDPWPSPIPSPAPSTGAARAVRPLTVDQLNTFMAMNSQSPSGRQLVITGTIVPNMMAMICATPCTGWLLEGSNPNLWVDFKTYSGPRPEIPADGLPLTFAATMGNGFVLEYQGPVSTTPDGGAFLPSQLPGLSVTSAGSEWLVRGWMGGPSNVELCPVVIPPPSPYPGPQYNCGEIILLSDNQPGETGGSVRVQDGAYQQFAPSPAIASSGTQPEQATFLVRVTYVPACGPTEDCFIPPANLHWEIVARVDPWPFPTSP